MQLEVRRRADGRSFVVAGNKKADCFTCVALAVQVCEGCGAAFCQVHGMALSQSRFLCIRCAKESGRWRE